MRLVPYLMFPGCCADAFAHYARVLRGEIVFRMTYGEMPDMPGCEEMPADTRQQIGHMAMVAGDATLMGADGPPTQDAGGTTINIEVDTIEEAERVFGELAEGGSVQMPIGETFWAHRWGTLVDRYGKPWMVNCLKPMPAQEA
ncbi:MAG: VOC family protein [Xanthomonadales bacterium]|nr:VOC family protein [Xanthomonadales bacterium]